MNYQLSVIIPCLNDWDNCLRTVRSIKESEPRYPLEVIVVTDGETNAKEEKTANDMRALYFEAGDVKVLPNFWHIKRGCGGARDYGAYQAEGKLLLFTDSHVRFPARWFEDIWDLLPDLSPHDVLCTTYNSVESWEAGPCRKFTGASMRSLVEKVGGNLLLATAQLNEFKPGRLVEVDIPVGAGYLVRRDFYLRTSPFYGLKGWGHDEELLALKAHSHGGRVLCSDQFNLVHVHTPPPPGRSSQEELWWNKLLLLCLLGLDVEDIPAELISDRQKFESVLRFHQATMGPMENHPLEDLFGLEQGDIEEALAGYKENVV